MTWQDWLELDKRVQAEGVTPATDALAREYVGAAPEYGERTPEAARAKMRVLARMRLARDDAPRNSR